MSVLIYSTPDKALLNHAEAAKYLGVSYNTFKSIVTASGTIHIYYQRNRKVYKILELDKHIKNLPEYNNTRESPGKRRTN